MNAESTAWSCATVEVGARLETMGGLCRLESSLGCVKVAGVTSILGLLDDWGLSSKVSQNCSSRDDFGSAKLDL